MVTLRNPPQEAMATVVAARAALEAAWDSERAEVLAWVQEAEQCLNSAEEVSLLRKSSGMIWSAGLRLAQQAEKLNG